MSLYHELAAFFLILPYVLDRVDAIQPDLTLVGLWCAAAAALILWWRKRLKLPAVLLLLSIGLLLGMKLSTPLHLLLLAFVLGIYLWWRIPVKTKTTGFSSGKYWLSTAVVVAILLGSSWYLRNLWQTGNPATSKPHPRGNCGHTISTS